MQEKSVFYVLPTYDLMISVVQNRIDKEIAFTDFYRQLIRESPGKSESARMKHIGSGVVKFVGSNTPNAFLEFPADTVIIDELDKCDSENILMAEDRQSASTQKKTIYVSNPTFPGLGISEQFKNTDRKWWHIKCDCNKWIRPDWFKHVVRKIDDNDFLILDKKYNPDNPDSEPRLICDKCNKPVDRFKDGEWVNETTGKSGYQISKLFSSTTTFCEMVGKFDLALTDPAKMQRFYNSELGLPYEAYGDKINRSDLDSIKADYLMPESLSGKDVSLIGIDVGSFLDVIIARLLPDYRLQVVHIGRYKEFEDIVRLIIRYNTIIGVMDAKPEIRLAKSFCELKIIDKRRFIGYRCNESDTIRDTVDNRRRIITTNRTALLDFVRSFILTNKAELPKNAEKIPDFYDQMTAAVRVFDDKRNRYVWEEGNLPDHFHHAFAFLLLAYKLLTKK